MEKDIVKYNVMLLLNMAKCWVKKRFDELNLGDKGYIIEERPHGICVTSQKNKEERDQILIIVLYIVDWTIGIDITGKRSYFKAFCPEYDLAHMPWDIDSYCVAGPASGKTSWDDRDFKDVVEEVKKKTSTWDVSDE